MRRIIGLVIYAAVLACGVGVLAAEPGPAAPSSKPAVTQVPFSREAPECPAWRFTKLPEGTYQITEVISGNALTAVSSDGGGVRIVVAPWQKSDEQKWELLKIDPAKLTM
jgi:hypothetical protein